MSSSLAVWSSVLEPASSTVFRGRGDPEDPRLGEVVGRWDGGPWQPRPGQPVLIGFPCDIGVRRNHGRPGAALAPDGIREEFYRFTTWDAPAGVDLAELEVIDLGNVHIGAELEAAQYRLAGLVAELLRSGAVPVVLGGGHETAFGHYLGYVAAGLDCGIINVDAHLDVRPTTRGPHSGTPFRQALEHPQHPLGPGRYVVIGPQRQSVAQSHCRFLHQHEGRIHWFEALDEAGGAAEVFAGELDRLGRDSDAILVTVDADAFRQADVPGTSAPAPVGLQGAVWPEVALRAGAEPRVRSIEIVEVNPQFDWDRQTTRWAALGVRQFLVGLATRQGRPQERAIENNPPA
ncbi:MAG TPA: formimidoylglutamase [Gemmataceae bacterium]|nr:formimidoylglutamase [Gemmataceae bacterium]